MIELLFSSHNFPFTVALCIMVSIGIMEGAGLLLGVGASNLLDSMFPSVDLDMDLPDDFQSPDFFSRWLTWLRVGKVPIIVLIIIALTSFGVLGFVIQIVSKSMISYYLPAYIASIPAFVLSIPVIRISSKILNRYLPEDESEAVDEKTFIGKVAVITIGTAKFGKPAEAKFDDQYGQVHYVMVEPDTEDGEFAMGTDVILIKKMSSVYKAMKNDNELLTNT